MPNHAEVRLAAEHLGKVMEGSVWEVAGRETGKAGQQIRLSHATTCNVIKRQAVSRIGTVGLFQTSVWFPVRELSGKFGSIFTNTEPQLRLLADQAAPLSRSNSRTSGGGVSPSWLPIDHRGALACFSGRFLEAQLPLALLGRILVAGKVASGNRGRRFRDRRK
jgi:hypothetical protein